jgi:hypothetical protein
MYLAAGGSLRMSAYRLCSLVLFLVLFAVALAGIWMVKHGPPVPDRVTPLADDRVAA